MYIYIYIYIYIYWQVYDVESGVRQHSWSGAGEEKLDEPEDAWSGQQIHIYICRGTVLCVREVSTEQLGRVL